MLGEITWKQFQDWMAYDELEPFGEPRDDLRFASVVSTLVNLRRNIDKYPDPFPVTDFLLYFGDVEEQRRQKKAYASIRGEVVKPNRPTWQQMKLMAQVLAASYNMMEESNQKTHRRRKKG